MALPPSSNAALASKSGPSTLPTPTGPDFTNRGLPLSTISGLGFTNQGLSSPTPLNAPLPQPNPPPSNMQRQQKAKKIFLRSAHFKDMTITFSKSNDFHGKQTVVGLNVKGLDAMKVVTEDGARSIAFSVNKDNGDITISETRGDLAKLRKGIVLSSGTYTVLKNKIDGGDVWSLCLQSSIPILVQNKMGDSGEVLAVAQRQSKSVGEITRIVTWISQSLILGKREPWFAQTVVNQVEVILPDCRNSKLVNIDDFVEFFNNSSAVTSQQVVPDPIDSVPSTSETGWEDDETVPVKAKTAEARVSSKAASLEEIPDNWFDDLEDLGDLKLEDADESQDNGGETL